MGGSSKADAKTAVATPAVTQPPLPSTVFSPFMGGNQGLLSEQLAAGFGQSPDVYSGMLSQQFSPVTLMNVRSGAALRGLPLPPDPVGMDTSGDKAKKNAQAGGVPAKRFPGAARRV